MWESLVKYGLPIRHVEYPQYEIHKGTQGSRFELRNTETNTHTPLFADNPNANIHTAMYVADEVIRVNEFLEKIKKGVV